MKRTGTVFLSILFTLTAFLAGCGSGGSGSSDKNPGLASNTSPSTLTDSADTLSSGLLTMDSFTSASAPSDTFSDPVQMEEFTNMNNDLAFDLYHYLAGDDDTKHNLVFGQYSFLQVLGMTVSGARGETAGQISAALLFGQDPDNWLAAAYHLNNTFKIMEGGDAITGGNIAWGHSGYLFSKAYLEEIWGYYAPGFSVLDYSTLGSGYKDILNARVSDLTAGGIQNIFLYSDTPQMTRLLLGNAAWLENAWESASDTVETFEGLFEKRTGVQYWVTMVRVRGVYNSYQDDEVSAFEIPVGPSGISMVVFMPHEGHFNSFEQDLKTRIPSIVTQLTPGDLEFVLPVFDFSYSSGLKGFMKDNGASAAFDMASADFSGINSLGYCYLTDFTGVSTFGFGSESLHAGSASAAVIEATPDEPGDVWSSHDAGFIGMSGCPAVYIKAGVPDARPFVFVLRDMNTNTILYMGRLLNPGGVEAGSWECYYGLDLVAAM